MKRFILTFAAIAALLTGMTQLGTAATGTYLGGAVTGNNSTDTTFTRAGNIPGNNNGVIIWSPDADCTIKVTYGSSASSTVQILIPVDPDPVELDLTFVISILVDKTTTQRVGVFFIGD